MSSGTATAPAEAETPPRAQPVAAPAAPATSPPGRAEPQRTVLCVDDEPNILAAMRRLFRSTPYRVLLAEGGAQALALLEAEPVDLIISDMRMPAMSGAELLQAVRQRWPQITRLLLTGYADMGSTIAAINEGQIQRYITKPWNDGEILMTVRDAFERLDLQEEKARLEALTLAQNQQLKELNASLEDKVQARTAELAQANDRLKKNYFNSIKTFSHLIELRGGQLVGHARKVADLARKTGRALGMDDTQAHELFIAGLMHDIGHIGLSDHVLATPVSRLSPEEATQYRTHPVCGEQALMGLDDMQGVASLIRWHHERWDGRGFPDGLRGADIPLGAQILAVADAYEDLQAGHIITEHLSHAEALTMIARARGSQFDPAVANAFIALFDKPVAPPKPQAVEMKSDALVPGMVLATDFVSGEGVMLLSAGHVLTEDLIKRIHTFERRSGRPVALQIKPIPPTQEPL